MKKEDSKRFSWRTNEVILLCLKNRGRTGSSNGGRESLISDGQTREWGKVTAREKVVLRAKKERRTHQRSRSRLRFPSATRTTSHPSPREGSDCTPSELRCARAFKKIRRENRAKESAASAQTKQTTKENVPHSPWRRKQSVLPEALCLPWLQKLQPLLKMGLVLEKVMASLREGSQPSW